MNRSIFALAFSALLGMDLIGSQLLETVAILRSVDFVLFLFVFVILLGSSIVNPRNGLLGGNKRRILIIQSDRGRIVLADEEELEVNENLWRSICRRGVVS